MLAFVMAATLAASPRPLPNAESGLYAPNIERIDGLVAFMTRAGERSASLRPSTWFSELHPLLVLDFTRPESLAAVGVDRRGSATVSWRGDGRMSCVDLSDPKRFEQRARERLATLGALWEGKLGGGPVVAAKSADGTIRAGYARKGNTSCAVASPGDAKPLLEAAVGALSRPKVGGRWAQLRGLSGAMFFVTGDGVAGFDGTPRTLTLDGRARLPAPGLVKGGQSPYAISGIPGLVAMRVQVAKSDVPRAVRSLTGSIAALCARCGRAEVAALEQGIAERLTGHASLLVHAVNVTGRLRSEADRYFAMRHAWLAEVDDAVAAKKALERARALPGARATGAGFAIAVPGGEISLGLQGRHFFVANDSSALKAALDALPQRTSPLAHGAELALDPARTSRALSSLSLFDVMGSRELAGLFALGTEIGPLLSITESVRAFADGDGSAPHRIGMTWTLRGESASSRP
jgi:hypothetical protein